MKRFLIEVTGVLFLIVAPLYLLQYIMDNAAQKSKKIPFSSFNYIYNDSINADVVIFGNSRAQCHYNTVIMDSLLNKNCYNLGLSAYSFDYQYNLQILPYIQNNIKPKLIILEVGPQALFAHWQNDYNKYFIPYLNSPHFDFYIDICEEISWGDRVLPKKYYGWGLDELYKIYKYSTEDSEYEMCKDCFSPGHLGMYIINFPDSLHDVERNEIIIQYFKDFVELCNSYSIPLLLVCSPMHKADFYDKCKMFEFWQQIDSLAPNTTKLDYSLMFGSDVTYFVESTHLNSLGSTIFTKQLAYDIDSLGLLK